MSKPDLYLYALAPPVLDSLELLHFDEAAAVVAAEPKQATPPAELPAEIRATQLQRCSTCNTTFGADTEPSERVRHYKGDWHRLNLKRAVSGLAPLSEAEFDDYIENLSLESISGSEDEDSEDELLPTVFEQLSTREEDVAEHSVSHLNTQLPYVLFKSPYAEPGQALGAYKAVFAAQALGDGAVVEALRTCNTERARNGISVLLMIGGGHFAGAVVAHQRLNTKGNAKNHKESLDVQRVLVVHSKTFHRYTTRRKQGGSQSASDNARGKANSAGSSIRRYNEAALQKDVRELLVLWRLHLDAAEHIFVRANGAASRKILVGYENAVIKSDDARVKSFPFTTKRATLSEVKSAWAKLTYLTSVPLPKAKVEKAPKVTEKKSATPEPAVQLSPSDVHTKEITTLLRKSKAPFLVSYLKKNGLDANFVFTPAAQHAHAPTPLHFAASQGLHHMVKVLLTNLKADPTAENAFGKTPAQIASTQQVRSTFQIARHSLGEEHCDWAKAKVGPAKTSEQVAQAEEEQKRQKLAESKKLIQEELAKKTELELKQPSFSSGGTVGSALALRVSETSGLLEQQKMRLMREQRARAAEARMRGK